MHSGLFPFVIFFGGKGVRGFRILACCLLRFHGGRGSALESALAWGILKKEMVPVDPWWHPISPPAWDMIIPP